MDPDRFPDPPSDDASLNVAPDPADAWDRQRAPRARRVVMTLAALVALLLPGLLGYAVGHEGLGAGPSASDTGPRVDPPGGVRSSADLERLADAVDDVVVNISTRVEGGGQAAGTGVVISEDGLVVTNNHVIAGTTRLVVELAATGVTRSARVLGYSVINDVALLQVEDVDDLAVAEIGSSSSLEIGDTVLALGNAGGRGGSPSVVAGTVTGLERQITASDPDGSNAQTLEGLIELAADIRSGDSGGPVVDVDGRVVGINVAASASGAFGFPGRGGGGQGYAIPIEDAMDVVERIVSGKGGTGIRVGGTRAVIGVSVQPSLRAPRGSGGERSGSGALVLGVEPGSGADEAGIREGDVIVAIGDEPISTTSDLTVALAAYDPGDRVQVTLRDGRGGTRRTTVTLGEGPPA